MHIPREPPAVQGRDPEQNKWTESLSRVSGRHALRVRDMADKKSLRPWMTPNLGIFHFSSPSMHTQTCTHTHRATPHRSHQTCRGGGVGLFLGGRWSPHVLASFQGTQVTIKAPGGAGRKVVYLVWD